MMESTLENVCTTVDVLSSHNLQTTANGMVIYYSTHFLHQSVSNIFSKVYIHNLMYRQTGCFNTGIQNILHTTVDGNPYKILSGVRVSVRIFNTTFNNLCNVRVLFYRNFEEMVRYYKVDFINCNIQNIKGATDLFLILPQVGSLRIYNSIFYSNVNITSVITINTLVSNYFKHTFTLLILKCKFTHNIAVSIIQNGYKLERQWRQPININIIDTIITKNVHNDGNSLISLNNGMIRCENSKIMNNSYYKNIVQLNLSYIKLVGNIRILNNHARNIFNTIEFSYTIPTGQCDKCMILISQNTVYSVLAKEPRLYKTKQTRQLCYFQVLGDGKIFYNRNYKIEITNNIYTAPNTFT